jgi:hypothetical protein
VELSHIKNDILNLNKSRKYLEEEMGKRVRITTLITITVVVLGVLSGLLGAIWLQAQTTSVKVDAIREHQVRVLTVLELRGLLETAKAQENKERMRESK